VVIALALAPPLAVPAFDAAAAAPVHIAAPAAAIAHAATTLRTTTLRRFARETISLVFSWAPLFPAAYGVS
jgi:hypothetical protein